MIILGCSFQIKRCYMEETRLPVSEVAVAGHICLDIIPALEKETAVIPGRLLSVGPAVTSTGGAVSNTGLALHRLGFATRLIGKVGDDLFGQSILHVLERYDPALKQGMVVTPGESSSYTVVVSPPGTDRCFWHYAGTNNTFGADDVDCRQLAGVRLFHLGYPTIMERLYMDGGEELLRLVRKVKEHGLAVSLDLAETDPSSPAAGQEWRAIFAKVLPYVDVFLPSLEEWLCFFRPETLHRLESLRERGVPDVVDTELLHELTGEMLDMGVAAAGLKLGSQGLYVRTSGDAQRLQGMGLGAAASLEEWRGKELLAPCFQVAVKGTTGAGDCTYAGFIGGLLKGLSLEETMLRAAAVGACNVEAADALTGIPPWTALEARLSNGWAQHSPAVCGTDWIFDERIHLYKRRSTTC
jgi:sugar/nucleoside kinase (ribokinase family)